MREIKFRAPDAITGQYVYFTLEQLGQTATSDTGLCLDLSKTEQFTGLLDKDGKGIYEGDILKTENEYGIGTGVVKDYGYSFGVDVVTQSREMVWGSPEGEHWSCEQTQVIGNLHENPELLE